MPSPDHRESAVEAATKTWAMLLVGRPYHKPTIACEVAAARAAVTTAEPHLQRMFFERFKEAMLSEEAKEAAVSAREEQLRKCREYPSPMECALQAALDQAERLMEEGETNG